MTYNIRWRRAVMVSVFCHIFIVAGAGYLSAQLLVMPIVQEQSIELELMNEFQVKPSMDSAPTPISASPTDISEPTLAPEKVQQTSSPSPVAVNDTPSVVTTGNLAMMSTSSNETTTGSAAPTSKGNTTNNGSTSTTNDAGAGGKPSSIIPPSILAKLAPPYPEAARQAGIEGTVVLKIQIVENGRADHISIAHSSGSDVLDEAAIATIKQWRFVPAKDPRNGQAIPCYTTIPISFRLKE